MSTILIVDDNSDNRKILVRHLTQLGHTYEMAEDGEQALDKLAKATFDLVLLDRMMPGMDGLEVLKTMKDDPLLRHIPVVFQTGKKEEAHIQEGIEAGARYYLTKPFSGNTLEVVVRTVIADHEQFKKLQSDMINTQQQIVEMLQHTKFLKLEFKSLDEARAFAALIGSMFSNYGAGIGLLELMLNAIEHGNLGVSYEEKTMFLKNDTWTEEIAKRLEENSDKVVTLTMEQDDDRIVITIRDQGKGFKWDQYLDFDPSRATHSHGRGIAMANRLSGFHSLEYLGCGNEVRATLAK